MPYPIPVGIGGLGAGRWSGYKWQKDDPALCSRTLRQETIRAQPMLAHGSVVRQSGQEAAAGFWTSVAGHWMR